MEIVKLDNRYRDVGSGSANRAVVYGGAPSVSGAVAGAGGYHAADDRDRLSLVRRVRG